MENSILKIYLSSTDKHGSTLLYEHIVEEARKYGINGATVYRGVMGYGPSSKHINTSRFWELTEKLPIVIEIIDVNEKIRSFYKFISEDIEKAAKGCTVTIQPIDFFYQRNGKS